MIAMSYTLSQPSTTQRSGLLGIVIGLHVGIVLLALAAKTIAPQIMEMPLIVDLLPAPEVEAEPQAKPLPMAPPEPVKRKPVPQPKAPAPQLETTSSTAPAESAPTAPPQVAEPAPPAPPAPPAVSQARFDADYLRNPPPPYPPLSRRMGEEGKVILRVSVNPQGTADSVEVRTTSGSSRLDESALKTVRNWKFIPAKRGDTAIQSWVLVPIIFKLEQ
ncbi:outer membrane transport energization protein TonB [Azonexus fungiphilus]|jgi:protein TonB|uniref:Protein TonB n=2 Tax=Azonexus fungiphilus TaxID=146940 RepID=A0A495WER9_9RHOO|nr:outer membrane transport energization protein TonB [Azonexus fungiphilus]